MIFSFKIFLLFLGTFLVSATVMPNGIKNAAEDAAQLRIDYNDIEPIFRTERGLYGEGRIFNANGLLVHVTTADDVNDHTGCSSELRGTNGKEIPDEIWIALIKRGNCLFEDKIANAYNHGAVAVIVYNDQDSIQLEKMKVIDKDRQITSIFTYKWVGEDFGKVVDNGIATYARLQPFLDPPISGSLTIGWSHLIYAACLLLSIVLVF